MPTFYYTTSKGYTYFTQLRTGEYEEVWATRQTQMVPTLRLEANQQVSKADETRGHDHLHRVLTPRYALRSSLRRSRSRRSSSASRGA